EARARASIVLDNLVESGFMTEGQVFGARRHPATAVDRRDERSPNYYLDWAFEEVKRLVDAQPKLLAERVFVVRTGLDVNLQREAENAIETSLRQHGRQYKASQAAAVIMDIDGTVRAMVGGRDYGASQFNRATDALRQPGSSFKPYVYAAAFENGFKPTSIVRDEPICFDTGWCPQNYGRSFAGAVTLTSALVRSINTIPVRLSLLLGNGNAKRGRAKIIDIAKKMGLRHPLTDSSSLPIGAAEVTVIDHTAAYTTFASGGKAAAAHAILEVRNTAGELVWTVERDGAKPEQVLSPKVALDMNMILNKAVEEGTGRRAILEGVKAAGKTGTTNGYRDAWFVGYTGNYVCGVWFGNDDYSSTNDMTGGSLPAMTWRQIMSYAHQGIEIKNIPGVAPGPTPAAPQVAASGSEPSNGEAATRPGTLSRRAVDILLRVERRMDEAMRAATTTPGSAAINESQRATASASPPAETRSDVR
ncbi:MAG TPA: penicillin-binding transpeptidase domain-containing protein, partial [Woeseiaceae bacterium]|nr:penicillin-binding transpeptidase domain-containing protein [Woeseiaceae bacterium]